MEKTENQALFSELTPEEAETVNGASHRRRCGYDNGSVYYSPRRRQYQEQNSRRHNYRRYRGNITFSAVVQF